MTLFWGKKRRFGLWCIREPELNFQLFGISLGRIYWIGTWWPQQAYFRWQLTIQDYGIFVYPFKARVGWFGILPRKPGF